MKNRLHHFSICLGLFLVVTNLRAQVSFNLAASPGVGANPMSVTAADVNGDGKLDLISANYTANTLTVLTNNGSGGFVLASAPGVGNGPYAVTAADVNGDGKPDLISANSGANTLTVLTNNGNGGFSIASSPSVGILPFSVITADVNGDGKVDLISANYTANTITVLTNNGSGGFSIASSPGVGTGPYGLTATDVNGDGKPDLITANNGASTLTILTNNGNGGFSIASSPSVGSHPYSVTAADVNGDGKPDLITANNGANTLTILTNNGSGGFSIASSPSVGNGPWSVTATDVNGDGKLDLIAANNGSSTLTVLTNNGSGGFSIATSPSVGNGPWSVTAADVNGDGKVDLITANYGANSLSVLINTTVFPPPIITVPVAITAEATSASGAVVNFSTSATNLAGATLTTTNTPASGSTFPLGTNTITVTATSAGTTTNQTFLVIVRDTTPPVVNVPANITLEATSSAGAVATFSPTAIDTVDGAVTVLSTPVSGSTFALGTNTVNCSATDSHGNTGTGSFKVIVRDTTPPVVNVPANITLEATSSAGAVATFSPTAADTVDGVVTVLSTPASGSIFVLGTNTVNCSATDSHGNTGNGSFTVTVRDTTPPALTVSTNITAEATSSAGAVVNFTTSANDLVSGGVTTTNTPASGSTFPLGTNTVTVTAKDAAGNNTSQTFLVIVRDTTPPVITLLGANPYTNTINTTFVDPGATASDIYAGNLTSAIQVSGTVNPNVAGSYPLTYTVNDGNGNSATTNRTVVISAAPLFILASSPNVGSAPYSVVAADVNGDGKPDLISANQTSPSTLTVLTNDGSGGFVGASSPIVGLYPYSVVAADINGDGKVDLISANFYGGTLTVLTNNGSGGFTVSSSLYVGFHPGSVAATDVNGDGKPDLISAIVWDGILKVLTNNGSGGFVPTTSPSVGSNPTSVVATDVNGDGKPDLISANAADGTLTVLTNNGSGGFVPASSPSVGSNPTSVVATDVNGDGKPDLISANRIFAGTLTVLTNNGSGGFVLASSPSVGRNPYSVVAADVNGDGWVDLISANFSDNTLTVLTNNGSGSFVIATTLNVDSNPTSVVATDVNGDGRMDLISANYGNGTLSILTNNIVFPPQTITFTLPTTITAEATSASGAVVTFSTTATNLSGVAVPTTNTPASGSTFPLGTNTVTVTATSAGNTTNQTFLIIVRDTTPPIITVPTNMIVQGNGYYDTSVYFTTSATDLVSGAVATISTPASDSTFPLGYSTLVTVTASDAAGNTASKSFYVWVWDFIPPVLTIPSNITLEATSPAGAIANYSVEAADYLPDRDRAWVNVYSSPNSGSLFPLGTNTVNCTAIDGFGNGSFGSFTVTVRDTTAPVIQLLGANPLTNLVETPFVDPGATATDIYAGDLTGSIQVSGTVNISVAGSYLLTYSVNDGNGNTATAYRTVVVALPPPTLTVASAGNQAILLWSAYGTNYILQSTTNLDSPNWLPATDAVPVISFTVTNNSSPARFFRLQPLP